jgi:hypothetical protein
VYREGYLWERTTKEAPTVAAPPQETTERPRTAPAATDGYAPPAAATGGAKSGKALAGMILGIISIPTAFLPIFGILFGVLAITFASLGKKEIRRDGMTNLGHATAGLVLGTIGLVLALALLVIGAIAVEN